MEKNIVLMVVFGSDQEALAIRSALEWFGLCVITKFIGRPNHFLEVLRDENIVNPDYIILVGHGDLNGFIMPELEASLYEANEPLKYITIADIELSLKISNKCIISTACASGRNDVAAAFASKQNIYIAPFDYIEGNSGLMFIIRFFYEIIENSKTIVDAYLLARGIDEQTKQFIIR